MEGKRFIRRIKVQNLLSFDEEGIDLELEPLNVLIGANGSGKSNLLEMLNLLRDLPADPRPVIRDGGGLDDWLWKGKQKQKSASIETILDHHPRHLRYRLEFGGGPSGFQIMDEFLEDESKVKEGDADKYFYYRWQSGRPVLNVLLTDDEAKELKRPRTLRTDLSIRNDQSVLAQRKDSSALPELSEVAERLGRCRSYRDFAVGVGAPMRRYQVAELLDPYLDEDLGNLSMVLNRLAMDGDTKGRIVDRLHKFNDRVRDIGFAIEGQRVQVYTVEEIAGRRVPISATRMSDGTLRFLALTAILENPSPPPLVCIDEPEVGLHPDMLNTVGDMLVQLALKCQVVVATHSDLLVSALSEFPEAIVVCEHDGSGTSMERLEPDKLSEWLESYNKNLGELWLRGHIGGTRW